MKNYRKKSIVIQAVCWTGNMGEVIELVGHDLPTYGPPAQDNSLKVTTLEGTMECRLGDWLIKGIKGEIYPCNSEIFKATYEEVN